MKHYPWLQTFEKSSDAEREEVQRLAGLITQWTARIRRAFLGAVERIADKIDVRQLAALLAAGRAGQALDMVNAALQQGGFAPVAGASTDAAIASGREAAQTPQLARLEASFGVTNPETISALQQYEFGLVRELTTTAREAVKQAVTAGVTQGRNPLETARDVKGAIGLTDRQAQAVANFRRALEDAPQEALDRALRDQRYDPTIARAVREQATIPPDKINAMVERYRQRYLKYRSEVIARTESIRSVNFGNMQAWRQAISDGKVPAASVTKRWIYTRDAKTRHAHRTIPTMNPVDPGIEEPFKSELGPIMYPGDPNATAGNVINCFHPSTSISVAGLKSVISRHYSGVLIELHIADGVNLTVTPNHPILTDRGWIAAGQLVKGDYLVKHYNRNSALLSHPNIENGEASAQSLACLAQLSGYKYRAHRGRVNLHGETPDHDIEVVAFPSELRNAFKAAGEQFFGKISLDDSNMRKGLLLFDSLIEQYRVGEPLDTNRAVGLDHECFSFLRSEPSHSDRIGFTAVSSDCPDILEALFDGRSLNAEFSGDFEFGTPTLVHCLDGTEKMGAPLRGALAELPIADSLAFGMAAFGYPQVEKARIDHTRVDAECRRNSRNRLASAEHTLDDRQHGLARFHPTPLLSVYRFHYEGPVFNFESDNGLLIADGIVNHNCRCAVVLRYKAQREEPPKPLAIEPPKPPPKRIVKPTKVQASFRGDVSPQFKAAVSGALDAQPKGAHAAVLRADIIARAAPFLTDINPHLKGVQPRGWRPGSTWDEVEGCYSPNDKMLDVAEKVRQVEARGPITVTTETARDPERIAHVTSHEFGHALDHALSYPSTRGKFSEAYKKDVAAYYAAGGVPSQWMGYFLQPGDAGPSEMFAEQWAEKIKHAALGPKPAPFPGSTSSIAIRSWEIRQSRLTLRSKFPTVALYMDTLYQQASKGIPKT